MPKALDYIERNNYATKDPTCEDFQVFSGRNFS